MTNGIRYSHAGVTHAGVRSLIIIFDVYVIHNIFKKNDNKRPDPICSQSSRVARRI